MTPLEVALQKVISGNQSQFQIIRFFVIGLLNTLVSYVAFLAFLSFHIGADAALSLAFVAGLLWNYQTIRRLVFQSQGGGQFFKFAMIYLILFMSNLFGLKFIVRTWSAMPLWLVQGAMTPIVALASFYLQRRLVFTPAGS